MKEKDERVEQVRSTMMENFRSELPVLRAKTRISQEMLAEKVGLSRQTYSGIETGKREMSWTTFLALLAFFQNNEQTRSMLKMIEGLEEGMEIVM